MKILQPLIIVIFFILSFCVSAQHTITGNFPPLAGQQIRLVGFDGFGIYTTDSIVVSEKGYFKLNYAKNNGGMGYLAAADNEAYFVVLANENIELKGKMLSAPESVLILSGKQNKLFVEFAIDHSKREQTLSAWVYLQNIYQTDSLFTKQKQTQYLIGKEIQRIKEEENNFLKTLDSESYLYWFLPNRKLVSSVATVAQYRTEEIPNTLSAFRKLDYSDERFYTSGLLKEAIESHFWLIENMGQTLDTVFEEMSISIDLLLKNLSKNETKFNEISQYLFNLLERKSMLQASEYLAIKVLTQNSCTINDDLANQLESYRTMKVGNTAPQIIFSGDVLTSEKAEKVPSRLSDIETAYKVVIFGASWCPKCVEELSQLLPLYQKWKSKGVEVVFVSLDTDKSVFKSFTRIFPFISICDYMKWESQAVKDYHVFATPTIYLLDKNQEILLRPLSIEQLDTWVDWFLVKENK
jgi:thiol-disulfide isomerase/thioredoxin